VWPPIINDNKVIKSIKKTLKKDGDDYGFFAAKSFPTYKFLLSP
jgi:hypothetical protein